MVLFVTLVILTVLMVVSVAAMVSMQTDYKITANLKSGAQAFFVAEAGVEWAKGEIYKSATNPPNLPAGTRDLSPGNFSISLLSSTKVTPLNGKLTVRSTGSRGGSSHAIQAELVKTYDLSDGAIALRGFSDGITFDSRDIVIDGRDYDPTNGNLVRGASARPAISTADESLKKHVEAAVENLQRTESPGYEKSVFDVSQSEFLPSQTIDRLATDFCAATRALVTSIPAEGTLTLAGQTWGSRSSPEIRCINGLSGRGDSVSLGENFSGAGILVVKDAELIASGAFRWEGLIVVNGNDIGVKIEGTGNKELYGSLIINETNSASGTASSTLRVQGAIRVLYSRAALNQATVLIPESVLESSYGHLPAAVSHTYWKVVTP